MTISGGRAVYQIAAPADIARRSKLRRRDGMEPLPPAVSAKANARREGRALEVQVAQVARVNALT